MNKIIVMRHFKSLANCRGIIQGNIVDLSIKDSTQNIIYVNLCNDVFKNVKKIICSQMKRAIETGSIISRRYNIDLTSNNLLNEVNCGSISSINHSLLFEYNSLYYDIWNSRKDLSGIIGAEKSNDIQSRVVLFLFEFYEQSFDDVLIVTHAIIMRTILNLFNGVSQFEPIDVSHNNYYILSDPWSSIKNFPLVNTEEKKIVHITTNEYEYIIKRNLYSKNKNCVSGYYIQNELSKKFNCAPNIYCFNFVYINKNVFAQKIEKYINGDNIPFYELNTIQKNNLFNSFKNLLSLNIDNITSVPITLKLYLNKLISTNKKSSQIFVKAINEVHEKILTPQHVVHIDPHKNNIVVEKNDIFLLDFDNIVLASKEFQFGCLLSCYILFENTDSIDREIINIIEFDKSLDLELIIRSVMLRSAIGIIHFENKYDILSLEQLKIIEKYKTIFFEGDKILNDKDRFSELLL